LPFPTLREALEAVDIAVGFYVEIKYPQIVYVSQTGVTFV
jgi:glycerophosphoryl diester phosphodiesterase